MLRRELSKDDFEALDAALSVALSFVLPSLHSRLQTLRGLLREAHTAYVEIEPPEAA